MRIRRKKKMEKELQEVEKEVDEIRQQKPHISFDKERQPQPQAPPPYVPNKNFLVTISDAETQVNLGVIAPNIMIAIKKFADKYQTDFNDLLFLNILIEEIEFIQ
jgi:hypothetical protein